MEELSILRTFAAATTVLAAALVAANVNARVTVAGFMIFIVASIAWMADGWLETKTSLVIQNVILLLINAIGVWRWFPKAAKEAKSCRASIAKPVTAQERLVDRHGCLRALPDSHSDKKDIARNVSRNIYPRNTAFFRLGINHHAPFVIPLAAKTF